MDLSFPLKSFIISPIVLTNTFIFFYEITSEHVIQNASCIIWYSEAKFGEFIYIEWMYTVLNMAAMLVFKMQ